MAGADQYDELQGCLKSLEYPFESQVKDLRSQVVRECCITIAYLSLTLRNKVNLLRLRHLLRRNVKNFSCFPPLQRKVKSE